MKKNKVGDTRERIVEMNPGHTQLSGDAYIQFEEGDADRRLVKVEKFHGEQRDGSLTFAAHWYHCHYRELTDTERADNPLPPELSWWARWRLRVNLARAKVVRGADDRTEEETVPEPGGPPALTLPDPEGAA